VNLLSSHAELRVQDLPTGAERDIIEESQGYTTEIGKYLDLSKLSPIDLVPVMDVMLRAPIYAITSSRLKFAPSHAVADAPEIVEFVNRLLKRSDPAELSAYWECEQRVLGRRRLHFSLNGASKTVDFGGLADPARMGEIIEKLVDISRKPPKDVFQPPGVPPDGGVFQKGIVDRALKKLVNEPNAQAVVLSAGAIAAAILWVVCKWLFEYARDYAFEWMVGFPVSVFTLLVQVVWIIFYYGWRRVLRGFRVLVSLPKPQVWKALNEARKHLKNEGTGLEPRLGSR
jgi:hypothetical protein